MRPSHRGRPGPSDRAATGWSSPVDPPGANRHPGWSPQQPRGPPPPHGLGRQALTVSGVAEVARSRGLGRHYYGSLPGRRRYRRSRLL